MPSWGEVEANSETADLTGAIETFDARFVMKAENYGIFDPSSDDFDMELDLDLGELYLRSRCAGLICRELCGWTRRNAHQ